jgi:hypothetical protein
MKIRSILALSALLSFSFGTLHAQVVMVSNLGATTNSSDTAGAVWQAVTFTTDNSSPSFTLNSLTLKLNGESLAGGNFFVAIYTHSVDEPGSLIGTLSGSASPATPGNFAYTATGITLSSNTSYWVVAGSNSGGNYEWDFSDNGGADSTWDIANVTVGSGDQGASWSNQFAGAYQFSVTATAIPEPGTWSLLAALVALVVARLRGGFQRQR